MCEHCNEQEAAEVSFTLRNQEGQSTDIKFSYEELEEFSKRIDEMAHKGHENFQKMVAIAYLSNKEVQSYAIRESLLEAKFATYREAVLEAAEKSTDLEQFRKELQTIENTNDLVEDLSPLLAQMMED
nr:MAG TPA: hypothetical protein [Caudoviricetes sp.]